MLFFLNAADGILTYLGVQSEYAVEVNAIMVPIVTNPVKLFLYKNFLPSILIGILYFIIKKGKGKSLMLIKRTIHALVCSLGISWCFVFTCCMDMACRLFNFSIKNSGGNPTVFYFFNIAIQFCCYI